MAADRGACRRLVAVVGPTASGKTALAVGLAELIAGELVSADSRQAIAEVAVGVCKPTADELHGIPCHGLDWRHLGEPFTAVDFVRRADPVVEDVWGRGRIPIVVGGTGLYVRALLRGYDFGRTPPRADRSTPTPLADAEALGRDVAELMRLAPDVGERVDLQNPRRVVRALELARAGFAPSEQARDWSAVQIGCRVEPGRLRARIESRAERLMGPQLRAEVATLRDAGYSVETIRGAAIGYAEVLAWMAGDCTREQAAQDLANRTWRYARAQRTWLRSEPGVVWIDAEMDIQGMVATCRSLLESRWDQEDV
ncbi:MAG: tRNA (adenosine(37)-N6)-dimethylallyltransferase MiaA [Candidatus Dormibacteria bacterium]